MAITKFDLRQSVLRSAQAMLGSAANDTADTLFPKINDEIAKLFEDRNVLLHDGGLITFTGTALQFTESLKISVNSKVAGGSPVVIDLGSSNRSFSASGRILYAVIDRSLGTATVTADASSLPAVTSANQEVFIIAKRVDATDGTKRVYFRNGTALDEGDTVRLGASGSGGSGAGLGDDINTMKFRASFSDEFENKNAVNVTAGYTDETLYSAGKKLFRLSYDATKTITTSGTSATLSGTPAFTVKAGDVVVANSEVRRIATVNSQTSYVLDAAFSSNLSAVSANVSQAVHTADICAYNDSGSGLALNSIFSDSISTYMINYRDSSALDDTVFDNNTTAIAAFSVSTDNSTWSTPGTRSSSIITDNSKRSTASSGTSFYLRFFSNATSGSGSFNVLDYKVYLYEDTSTSASGGTTSKALCRTDGAGTASNCSVSSDTGKTRITTTFVIGSEVNVYLDGQKLPEYVDATLTPDGYFKRITGTVIELDSDYSGAGLQVEVILPSSTVDNTNSNSTLITAVQSFAGSAFQGFVDESTKLTAVNGTPTSSQFRSAVTNRGSIPDLANDMRARFGIDRIPVQQIIEVQTESGPNGERVFKALNDDRDVIRFVGGWSNTVSTSGSHVQSSSTWTASTDLIEVTFFGTGLNLLRRGGLGAISTDLYVDGSFASTVVLVASSDSGVITARNYGPNIVTPVVSGLSLGLHTVQLRGKSSNADNLMLYGFEVLNESSTINIRPGTSYINGKKLALSAAQSLSYNSSFDSIYRDGASVGSLSTRGAHVLVYQKSDGTVGKAAIETNSSAAYLSSADHTNEEIVKTFFPREFGCGRSDDFSTASGTSANRAFTLEDGTTTLSAQAAQVNDRAGTGTFEQFSVTSASDYHTFTFVGTGLDILIYADASRTNTVTIDGTSVGTLSITNVGRQWFKIASGLPYGTHTVKMTALSSTFFYLAWRVYQPKKPTLPAGAVELAEYNLMADFSANAVATYLNVSQGVLRKMAVREFSFKGTWSIGGPDPADAAGFYPYSGTTGDSYSYTFFGTGFDHRFYAASAGYNFTIAVDGSTNLSGYTTGSTLASGMSFTASTGTVSGTPASPTYGNSVRVQGLTLGLHTVTVTRGSMAASFFQPGCFDIITPIHAAKVNTAGLYLNAPMVGSCALADIRKTEVINLTRKQSKMTRLTGNSGSPVSVTSNVFVPIPDLGGTIYVDKDGWYMYDAQLACNASVSAVDCVFGLFVDGAQYGDNFRYIYSLTSNETAMPIKDAVYLTKGIHHIQVYFRVSSGTLSVTAADRKAWIYRLSD